MTWRTAVATRGVLTLLVWAAGCDAAQAPRVTASPTSLTFADTVVGDEAPGEIRIWTDSASPVEVSAVVEGEDFELLGSVPSHLQPGTEPTLRLRFEPSRPGPAWGRLRLMTPGPPVEVLLSGVGVAEDACDDGNPCTRDRRDPSTGACSHYELSGPCDDGDPCTTEDACLAGTCTGRPVDCDDRDPCTADTCAADGTCRWSPGPDGVVCGPAGICSLRLCRDGECVESPRTDGMICGETDACNLDVCLAGGCVTERVPDGRACDDENACTVRDRCSAGRCAGLPQPCDGGNACTTASCEPTWGCVYEVLEDGLPCGGGGACAATDACPLTAVCAEGICERRALQGGGSCDDGDACTVADICGPSGCVGQAVDCDDGNACTADSCDPAHGCRHEAVTDGVSCGAPTDCAAASLCQAGVCVVLSPAPDGAACDDGDLCTAGDACQSGRCIGRASEDTALLHWTGTWNGWSGAVLLGGDRVLFGDPDRVTVVDVSGGSAVPIAQKFDDTPFGRVLPLDHDHVLMASTVEDGSVLRMLDLAPGRALEESRLLLDGPVRGQPEAVSPNRFALLTGGAQPYLRMIGLEGGRLHELGRLPTEATGLEVIPPYVVLLKGLESIPVVDVAVPAAPRIVSMLPGWPVDETHPYTGVMRPDVLSDEAAGRLLLLDGDGVLTLWDAADPLAPRPMAMTPLFECVGAPELVRAGDLLLARCNLDWPCGYVSPTSGVVLDATTLEVEGSAPDGDFVGSLDARHYVMFDRCLHSLPRNQIEEATLAIYDRDVLSAHLWEHWWMNVPEPAGLPSSVMARDGLLVEFDRQPQANVFKEIFGPFPRIRRWKGCGGDFSDLAAFGAGPAGPMARVGHGLRSEHSTIERSVDTSHWPTLSLGRSQPRPWTSIAYAPDLKPGPLLTTGDTKMDEESLGVCNDPGAVSCVYPSLSCTDIDTGEVVVDGRRHLIQGDSEYDTYDACWSTAHALANGPYLVLSGQRKNTCTRESHSPELQLFDLDGFLAADGPSPASTWTDLPCLPAPPIWASPTGDTVALASPGCFALLDSRDPQAVSVVIEDHRSDVRVLDLRIEGDRMLRLMDEDGRTFVRVDDIDRATLPWSLSPLVATEVPGARTLLAFDGRTAVAGGAAPTPESGARGMVWTIDSGLPYAAAAGVPVPVAPRWGLEVPEGLLISADDGVGAMSLACGR